MTRLKTWRLKIRKSKISSRDLLGLLGMVLFLIISSSVILRAANSTTPAESIDQPTNNAAGQATSSQQTSENQVISPPPPPTPPPPPPKPQPFFGPSSVLNLSNWKLTLPVDTSHAGTPDEIKQPELSIFTLSPYFQLNNAKNGVIFRADVNGTTTSGSNYPRSELREMTSSGTKPASWSNATGTHTMIIRQAITHSPVVKPDVVAGQIHDASDDVIMVRLEGNRLFIEGDEQAIGELDSNYSLGTVFTVRVVAAEGRIKVYYNDVLKVDYSKSGSGYYFKAGCYTLSNTSKGDSPSAYGQVIIYDLRVSHS